MTSVQQRKLCPMSRYDTVKSALQSADLTVEHAFRATTMVFGPTILDSDGPRHRVAKGIIAPYIADASKQWFRQHVIAPIVRRNWEAVTTDGHGDVLASFAMTVPPEVMFNVLGLPETAAAEVYRRDIRPVAQFIADNPKGYDAALAASERLSAFIAEFQSAGTADKGVIDAIIAAYAAQGLSSEETVSSIALLLAAGTETTVCAVANLFFRIGESPSSWDEVLSGDLAAAAFVEEVLRFEAPLQRTYRFAKHETVIAPCTAMERGDIAELMLGEANRGQPAIENPERWRPADGRGVGVTFGLGRHSCLGKSLAIAELLEIVAVLGNTGFRSSSIRRCSPPSGTTFRRPDEILVRCPALDRPGA